MHPIYRTGVPLLHRVRFLHIQSTNIFNYFFRHSLTIFVYSFINVMYFLMLPFLVHEIFTYYINGVLNCKYPAPGPKALNHYSFPCGQLVPQLQCIAVQLVLYIQSVDFFSGSIVCVIHYLLIQAYHRCAVVRSELQVQSLKKLQLYITTLCVIMSTEVLSNESPEVEDRSEGK